LNFNFHIRNLLFFTFFWLILSSTGFSQKEGKLFRKAKYFFDNEEFAKALPILLNIDSTDNKDDFYVKYYIGACYLNTKYQKTKGIPYLEYAIDKGEKFLPKDVFFDLSRLYHLNYQFLKSQKMLQRYFKLAGNEDAQNLKKAYNLYTTDSLAMVLQKDSEQYEVSALPYPINTSNSEKMAFVSADNNVLFFSRTYLSSINNLLFDSVQQIMMAVKEKNHWSIPQLITIKYDKKKYVSRPLLIGISFDARYLFFKITVTPDNSDLFIGELKGTMCTELEPLPEVINSAFNEEAISFTPEGDVCYFSSNRPGGYGKMDLYKSVKLENNKWSKPENLGSMINSEYDENYPFIHPNGKRLYFASDNIKKSIGGYDIFVTDFSEKISDWLEPQNIGLPINTPSNDISFVPNAEGNFAYYSSSTNNEKGNFNLYVVRLEQSIPLTLIRGFIYESETKTPIPAQISVYDAANSKKIKYIYNPNPETGKYLMIFPPGKNYQMVVQAKGYYHHLIEIYVPHQSYFYELYQEIGLKPIMFKNENKRLGEEIEVNNIFYDTERFFKSDTLQIEKIAQSKNYEPLLNLVGDIISLTDSMGLEYVNNMIGKDNACIDTSKHYTELTRLVENAIDMTDSTLLQKINNETVYKETTKSRFFYDQLDTNQYQSFRVFGKDTIWVASVVNTQKPKYQISNPFKTKYDSLINNKAVHEKLINKTIFFFTSGSFLISNRDKTKLAELIDLLLTNPPLSIEIVGYADSDGDQQKNLDLSYKRAFEVARTIKEKGIDKRRIQIKGVGEPNNPEKTQKEKQQNRRVEIIIQEAYFD